MSIPDTAWIGIIIGLILFLVGVPPIARVVARLDGDPGMFRMVLWAGALKLACAPLLIYVVDHFYGGISDAYSYSRVGGQLAAQIRQGDFAFHLGRLVGDGATSLITGFIFVVIDSNILGGFFVFAFLSFVSLVLFYRAFRIALPNGDHRRYAWLVLFFPSLLFWTSEIGKDSLISLGLGLGALGGAKVLMRARGGYPLLAAGLALTALVRPHVALMLFAGLAIAYPFSKAKQLSPLTPIVKVAQFLVLVAGGLLLARVTAHFLGLHSLSASSIEHVLQQNAYNSGSAARNQVGQFGSSEAASTSLSPLALPKDFYYTVMRPLPFQAHGLTQLASSAENSLIILLIAVSFRRLASALRSMRRHPYLLASLIYSLLWVLLFASIGNLGILARERTSLLPFLFVLISMRSTVPATVHAPAPAVATRPALAAVAES